MSNAQVAESLVPLMDSYQQFLRYEKGYSKHTLSAYMSNIKHLAAFLTDNKLEQWAVVNLEDLKPWMIGLRKAGIKPRSLQLKISSVKGFFKFLYNKQHISHNPSELLQAPKTDRPLPKNMEVDQLQSLLNFQPEEPIEFRDKAIMELFYSSGLRLSELADLDLTSLSSSFDEVRVVGKGNKERVVPVGGQARVALAEWCKVRSEFRKIETEALFLSKLGNRLSTRQIQQRLKHWASKQGLSGTLHPHKLRHSFASHILESSGNLRAVQELLGHANLSTTQVYTHLDFQHLAKVYDQAHPRAKKTK